MEIYIYKKNHTKVMNYKYQLGRRLKILNDLMNHILYILNFQDYFKYIIKCHETMSHNYPIRIYVKQNRKQDYI